MNPHAIEKGVRLEDIIHVFYLEKGREQSRKTQYPGKLRILNKTRTTFFKSIKTQVNKRYSNATSGFSRRRKRRDQRAGQVLN